MPGYKVPFLKDNSVYICVSCGLLLRDAMQTFCGHHYCESCIRDIFTHHQCFGSIKCAHKDCDKLLERNSCFPDKHVRREILQMTTPCLYVHSGCKWIGEVRSAEDHYKECPCQPVPCRNIGCKMFVPPNLLARHQDHECPFRVVVCSSCNKTVKVADHVGQFGSYPDNQIITCPKCGKENIQLCELKKHQHPLDGDCPQKQCPYQEYGCVCAEGMSHDQLKSHLEESQLSHSLMFVLVSQKSANDNQHRLQDVVTQIDAMRQSLATAETKIADHEWALGNLYQMFRQLPEDMKKNNGGE